jgi:hypothetical protein
VAVVEMQSNGVVSDRLHARDLHILLSCLQYLLAGPVTPDLGRRRVNTQVLERQLEAAAVLELEYQHS